MNLTVNSPTNTVITISDTLLDDFIASPVSYTNIKITGYFNDTETGITETYTDADPITDETNVRTEAGVETIVPAFFSTEEFAQGVYHFVIILTSEATIETSEGCIFVEDDLGCTIDDYRDTETDQFKKLNAGIDYFLLKNTAECQCNCDSLIDIYNNLITQTSSTTCKTC